MSFGQGSGGGQGGGIPPRDDPKFPEATPAGTPSEATSGAGAGRLPPTAPGMPAQPHASGFGPPAPTTGYGAAPPAPGPFGPPPGTGGNIPPTMQGAPLGPPSAGTPGPFGPPPGSAPGPFGPPQGGAPGPFGPPQGGAPGPFGPPPAQHGAPGPFGPPPAQHGAPGPFGPPPAQHGAPGPFGPPPGPAGAVAPFGAAAGAAPAGAPGGFAAPAAGAFDVEVQGMAHGLPAYCACCMAPPQTTVKVMRAQSSGRTVERRTVMVPYCQRCAAHLAARRKRGLTIGAIATAAGVLTPILLALLWSYAPAAVIIVIGALVGLGVVALLHALWKEPPIARAQGCATDHEALGIEHFYANVMRLRAFNPHYAQQLAQAYNSRGNPAAVRARLPARWATAALLGLLAGIPAYFLTHGTVYLDNPSLVPLTFDVDDGAETVVVPPGGHEHLRLPVGERQFVVQMNNQLVDRFTGEVDVVGNHVATPLGTACYARVATAYGSSIVMPHDVSRVQTGQRFYTLESVDYVLEPFPQRITVNQHQSGAVKHRFARVNCANGSPLN